jgi:CHAT domain-containing protein
LLRLCFAIPKDGVLVEFIQYEPFNPQAKPREQWGEPRYAAYLLHPDGNIQWADLGSVADVQPLIQNFNRLIKDPSKQKQPEQAKAVARELDAKLMQPVRALLKQQLQHLLIAPDGELNLIPFAALGEQLSTPLLLGSVYSSGGLVTVA